MGKIIDGAFVSSLIKDELKNKINQINKKFNKVPCLCVIILGDNPASQIYVKNKEIACEYVGIKSIKYTLPETTSESQLISLIENLNNDKNINGILVQLPLPNHINEQNILLKINPEKDVDCFNPYNIGMLSIGNNTINPCTSYACISLLKKYEIDLKGKNCLIIGRSNIVGKPLSMLLLKEDATVTIAHSKTQNITNLTQNADIIFLAMGNPKFLKGNMIKDGAIIIDIGINRTKEGIFGDCDFNECIEKASFITPVPKGVGPMTITILLENCFKLFELQNNITN